MRSKTSFFNKTLFKKSMKRLWPVWSGYLLFLFIAMPVQLFARFDAVTVGNLTKTEVKAEKIRVLYEALNIGSNEIIVVLVSLGGAILVFSYLFKQCSSNMMHAFPLSRKELFFSNYFAGIVSFLIPQLIVFFCVIFLGFIYEMPQIEYVAYVFLLMAGESFLYYSIAVFSCMFTGVIVAVPFFFFGFNLLYVGVKFIIYQLVMAVSFGMNNALALDGREIFSPMYCIFQRVGIRLQENATRQTCSMKLVGTEYMVIYLFSAIVIVFFAYFMYRCRVMEYAGDMVCIPVIKPFLRWETAIFCGEFSAAFLYNVLNDQYQSTVNKTILLVCLFVIGIFVFFVMEMILEKTIHIFTKKCFVEAVVLGILLVGTFFIINLDPFGMEQWLPKPSEVKQAYLCMWEVDKEKDEENIKEIIKLQKQLILKKNEIVREKKKNYIENNVEIKYLMKDGTIKERNYRIYTKQNVTMLKKSPKDGTEKILYDIFKRTTSLHQYMQGIFCENYDQIETDAGSLEIYNADSEMVDVEDETREISKRQMNEVVKAIKEDVTNGALASYEEGEKSPYWYMNGIAIDFHSKNYIIDSMRNYYQEDELPWINEKNHKGTAYVRLNKGFTRTIKLLIKYHIIKNKDELLTEAGYMEKQSFIEE